MPAGCIFADKGPAAFVADDDPEALLALLALTNSRAFALLVSLQMAFGSYEVGVIQRTPVPDLNPAQRTQLAQLARRAWSLKRTLDTTTETSHAFLLPLALRPRQGDFDPPAITAKLAAIQAEIDQIAFELYDFSPDDRALAMGGEAGGADTGAASPADETDDADDAPPPDTTEALEGLLSWAVGVAVGRFDWRLAIGERTAPAEPDPFDPLPARSPGMLPEGAAPFQTHPGILVDDPGHPLDLTRLVERVLERVEQPVPTDLRRWLQRKFFALHLQAYSKSRRKAPIFWPLATASGGYTLWLDYHRLTSQTLYTAVNDFVEPKLRQVTEALAGLRARPSRTQREEAELTEWLDLEVELRDFRERLLEIAKDWRPNHDDGVQITAAPLWSLFRLPKWRNTLQETWNQLAQGDFDWAHLALSYWPERVLGKCHQDRSLAIAHGVEADFWEQVEVPVTRGKKTTGATKLEWRPKALTAAALAALIRAIMADNGIQGRSA
ncbi:hypothetical protein [uncultured Thiohalocapsa sp.]|uniref:hypothetical protein n=1 Tax=uncultured Thiohalocapsa sp. TaxID=768990 RepID=UPI0025DFC417|nr:hypothetical protein [uncultured Thiohalocapsa sp.]